jgi:hypothetical protein
LSSSLSDLRAGARVPRSAFSALRRRCMLDGCKWDAQVGDEATLADWPLVLGAATWRELVEAAGALARETLDAEAELLAHPEWHARLALARRARRRLAELRAHGVQATPDTRAQRLMRFDFHPTASGWRVSEVNSDVPGGFAEASPFSAGIAGLSEGLELAGDPAGAFVDAIVRAARTPLVVLLSAPGYVEDHQVVAFLARRLRALGLATQLAAPSALRFADGRATLSTPWCQGEVGAIVRFYQAEWLTTSAPAAVWLGLAAGVVPTFNPITAMLTESKRLPLVAELAGKRPTWRERLPETRDPRDAAWAHEPGWILKAAYGNTGDTVVEPGGGDARTAAIVRAVGRRPGDWVAQRRFEPVPVATPDGPRFPCVGVYTLGERVIGAYGRISRTPIVDYRACDVAVLIERAAREAS